MANESNTRSSPGVSATRIVACQGAVQLASAVAAMWTTSGRTGENGQFVNHLIIHDLSAPDGQAAEFAECIGELANKLEDWQSICFVEHSSILQIQGDLLPNTMSLERLLHERFEIQKCDELYVGQNNKSVPGWLRKSVGDARQICFGDGIAINFSNAYFRPKEYASENKKSTSARKWHRRLKNWLRGLPGKSRTVTTEAPFDTHCLLLKNLFDQQLERVVTIDPALFLEIFDTFAQDLPHKAPQTHAALSELSQHQGQNVVLLTSNFSETGRMSLDGEIRGYRELLQRLPKGDDVALIIKPHPRDSYEKIETLQRFVGAEYQQTIALSDAWTFYLPFESLYSKYFAPDSSSRRETHLATVSSACISLEYLYQQTCELGFGQRMVDSEFVPLWRDLRQVHERDLAKVVKQLRASSNLQLQPHAA